MKSSLVLSYCMGYIAKCVLHGCNPCALGLTTSLLLQSAAVYVYSPKEECSNLFTLNLG
jgi:hypothetical protein